jgi:16S rRNA (uracil1498-N3)-methyltransferase
VYAEASHLRTLQKDHNLILLQPQEFAALTDKGTLNLPDRHREHFGRVLRRRETFWPALVSDGSGKTIRARVENEAIHSEGELLAFAPKPPRIVLVQAWVKNKALSLILQKAAEIGVQKIWLTDTEHSQLHSEKPARIDAILENACMQAYNPLKPEVVFAAKLSDITLVRDETFFGDLEAGLSLAHVNRTQGKSAVFINGPEGGFSPAETAELRERATGVLLSENVLRSDSAAIIALGFLRLPA